MATLDETRTRILKKMTRFLAEVCLVTCTYLENLLLLVLLLLLDSLSDSNQPKVAVYAEVNMMTPANLGIVFSPNVIQTPAEADVFRQFEVF